jgi:hypothetical protein
LIRAELLNGQYRAAYLTLYMHYNTGVGGVQSVTNLIQMIECRVGTPEDECTGACGEDGHFDRTRQQSGCGNQ